MALTITVGGSDRTSSSKLDSIEVINTIAQNADTADVTVSIPTSAGWRPYAGNEIVVANGATREFAGIITDLSETLANPARLSYVLSCRDYTHLFNRRLVIEEYATATANSIVSDIVSTYTSGFTTTNVMSAPSVGAQTFDYLEPSQAIRQLADLIGYGWYIDYDKDVHFYSLASSVAPVASIDLDSDVTNYGDMKISESVSHGLKNRVYVKGFKQKSSGTMTSTFTGDGTTKFFFLGYEPASALAGDITGTRAGNSLTFGTDIVDSQPDNPIGGANDVYLCFINMGARFDTAPASSDALSLTFKYMREIPTMVEDLVAQSTAATREGSGDGIHEFVLSDPGLTAPDGTDTLALLKGRELLSRYAYARVQTKFRSFTQGWRAGQHLTLTSSVRLGGLSKTFYVQQVTKRIVNHPSGGSPTFVYDVELSDSQLPV